MRGAAGVPHRREAHSDGVTIKEVARHAGVSVATVSRVLNDSGPVSEAARQRILESARELRFVPSGAARSLITRRTSTLGVLLPDLYGEFFSEFIHGIDQAVRQHGYHLLVSCSHSEESEITAALRAMRGRVDGFVIMAPEVDLATLLENLPDALPIVLLNNPVADRFDTLTLDNFGGAYAATEHLVVAHGHRRVALLGGTPGNFDARERLRGYRAALREAGIEPSEEWEIQGDFSEEAGYAAIERILRLTPRPSAVFAANDSMAIGALSALQEAGVRVPEELALVGFDDIPIARYLRPPLTSVHVPIRELGKRAVEHLMRASAAKNPPPKQQDVLPSTLVVRRSCGCGSPESEGAGGR